MYTIREVDPNDKANFIVSPNLFEAAKSRGWWKEGTAFDFTKMYSGGEYAHKYYSGRRMWRGFQMAKPSLKLPANYEDRASSSSREALYLICNRCIDLL